MTEAIAEERHKLHEQVTAVVDRCSDIARTVFAANEIVGVLARPSGDGDSLAVTMRQQISGRREELGDCDPIVEPLAMMARDIYPVMLIPALPDQPRGHNGHTPFRLASHSLYEHPAASVFLQRLADDPLIELLKPEGKIGFFRFSSGTGMTVEPTLLAMSLIGAAFARANLLKANLTFASVVDQLTRIVEDLRAVGRSESIDLPVAVHLQGIELEPGRTIDLPWGTLRALDQNALIAIGDLVTTQGALFVTTIKTFVAAGPTTREKEPPSVPPSKLRAFQAELDGKVHKTTLALLLSQEDPPLCGVPTLTVGITPFFGTGWSATRPNQDASVHSQTVIASNAITALRSAAELVDNHYAPPLEIPTRRLTSALLGRDDTEDGLVDAIVALESLFAGTDSGELTFRIGASMAWLIGHDADDRLRLHREMGELYSLRSKILHRGHAGQDVSKERDRTVQLALRAVRALLEDHPDLVADENRGKKLIMRGERISS